MPLVFPDSVINELKLQSGPLGEVVLVDIELRDFTQYFLTDVEGKYPSVLAGIDKNYVPWVKAAGPFKMTSDSRTDAGDLTLQNISGNPIEREVAGTFKAKEFEGALVVLRLWLPLCGYAIYEQHGTLTDQRGDYEDVGFRLTQIFDANLYFVADDIDSATCTLLYKGGLCGSASGQASCNKTVPDCVVRAARERFNGTPGLPPSFLYSTPIIGGGRPLGGGPLCTKKGTLLEPLGGPLVVEEVPWSRWILLRLEDGTRLDCVPEHPVYTDRGKTAVKHLRVGEEVITRRGMVRVHSLLDYEEDDFKLAASVPGGQMYWATSPETPTNAILSHNLKPFDGDRLRELPL